MKYFNGEKTNQIDTIIKINNEILNVETITDIASYITSNSTIQLTILFQKIWIQKVLNQIPSINYMASVLK